MIESYSRTSNHNSNMNGMNMMSTLTASARTALARGGQYGAVGVRDPHFRIEEGWVAGGRALQPASCGRERRAGKGLPGAKILKPKTSRPHPPRLGEATF